VKKYFENFQSTKRVLSSRTKPHIEAPQWLVSKESDKIKKNSLSSLINCIRTILEDLDL
jgi:hypothetical protein